MIGLYSGTITVLNHSQPVSPVVMSQGRHSCGLLEVKTAVWDPHNEGAILIADSEV